ncbi:hypothetical protein BY458DRAFT_554361 [Sporodiniella umbellata]|nr:hypothetical protein BY458DRAFT_554361 [Sporodiniella umbellata]
MVKSNVSLSAQPLQGSAEPPSPTLSTASFITSVSWMAEKTSNELIPMLKNAYSALKDKEKDLLLAAEIGKSLLEHNIHLKTSYDSLLHSATPPITPSSSTTHKCVQENTHDWPDLTHEEEESDSMRIIPSCITRETMIEVLDKKNIEVSKKLEIALLEQDKLVKHNSKNTRKLELEISLLKSNLEIATVKMEELEEVNKKQKKQEEVMATKQKKLQMDEALMEELYNEIIQMEKEKQNILRSKAEVELKLSATLKDLGELKGRFEKFKFTEQDFEDLKDAYQRQFTHIEELKTSLEEHRNTIQFLKERHSAISECEETSGKHTLFGTESKPSWVESSIFTAYEKNHSPLMGFESLLSKATGMSPQTIMEAISLIEKVEAEQSIETAILDDFDVMVQDIYPKSGLYPPLTKPENLQLQCFLDPPTHTFSTKLQTCCQNLFKHVWKWCRFSVILTAALIINAWHGPDSLLITY